MTDFQPLFRVLLPVSDLESAAQLGALAAALAASRDGEVVVLHVSRKAVDVGHIERHNWPAVDRAVQAVEEAGVSASYVIRTGNSVDQVIRREAVRKRADLLLLGWRWVATAADHTDSVLDTVLANPPCDVLVLGGPAFDRLDRFLVPVSGGPNVGRALELALGLADESDGQVTALFVCSPPDCSERALDEGKSRLHLLLGEAAGHPRLEAKVIAASSPIQGIVDEAGKGYDLVWMGASQASVIDTDLLGVIPRRVATESGVPLALVRRRSRLAARLMRWTWWRLFNFLPTLSVDERRQVQKAIYRGARPRIDFFLMMVLSAAIAAFGLLLGSPAVIIGAMLVAPLMSAIVGIGLGVVLGGAELLRKALWTAFQGMILAIGVSALIGLLRPGMTPTHEIMSRIQPGLLDLGVALASGAAAAYALCRRDVSASLAGVAIAAALVPPLAVVGIGLSMARWDITLGALLLYLTNFVAIASAGGLIFLLLGFAPPSGRRARWAILRQGVLGELVLLALIALMLTWIGVRDAAANRERQAIHDAILAQIEDLPETQLDEDDIVILSDTDEALELSITIRSPGQLPYRTVVELQEAIATRLQRTVALKLIVIPTTKLDPLVPPTPTPTATPTSTPTPGATATAGPSATPSPTVTATRMPTATLFWQPTDAPTATAPPTLGPSATPTSTSTPTVAPTPAPVHAVVSGTGNAGLMLRETPKGPIVGGLYEGQRVELFDQRQVVDGVEWAFVRGENGQAGWVVSMYLELP